MLVIAAFKVATTSIQNQLRFFWKIPTDSNMRSFFCPRSAHGAGLVVWCVRMYEFISILFFWSEQFFFWMWYIYIYIDVFGQKVTSPTLKADYERYPQSEKVESGNFAVENLRWVETLLEISRTTYCVSLLSFLCGLKIVEVYWKMETP